MENEQDKCERLTKELGALGKLVEGLAEDVGHDQIGDTSIVRASMLLRSMAGELALAKAANREQRRAGYRDALQSAVEFVHSLFGDRSEGWRDATTVIWNKLKSELDKMPAPNCAPQAIQEGVCHGCGSKGMGYGFCYQCHKKQEVASRTVERLTKESVDVAKSADPLDQFMTPEKLIALAVDAETKRKRWAAREDAAKQLEADAEQARRGVEGLKAAALEAQGAVARAADELAEVRRYLREEEAKRDKPTP